MYLYEQRNIDAQDVLGLGTTTNAVFHILNQKQADTNSTKCVYTIHTRPDDVNRSSRAENVVISVL